MLDAAGWTLGDHGEREKDRRTLRLRIVAAYPNVSIVKRMPEMFDQIFAAISVDINLVEVEDTAVYGSTNLEAGEAVPFMKFASNNDADPKYLLYDFFASTTAWGGHKKLCPYQLSCGT